MIDMIDMKPMIVTNQRNHRIPIVKEMGILRKDEEMIILRPTRKTIKVGKKGGENNNTIKV